MKIFIAGLSAALWFGVMAVCSGCSDLVVFANKEGLAALGDNSVGLITESKQSPDTTSAYWENRKLRFIPQPKAK